MPVSSLPLPAQVHVVGGGISGAACARSASAAGLRVQLHDRARNPGGRLATYDVDGRRVDVGASYFTAQDPAFAAQTADWESRGLARQWTDTFAVAESRTLVRTTTGPMRWAAPAGLRSLVVDLQQGLAVQQEHEVEFVDPGPQIDGVVAEAVVLAMPDPQAADLLAETLHLELEQVESRGWESTLALYAGWPSRSWDPDLTGVFVNDDPVLRWIADDGSRRGDGAPVLVAHSTPELAVSFLDDPGAAVPAMLVALSETLGIATSPDWVKVKRWSLTRPSEGRPEPYYLGDAMVGLCGDGWHGTPRVESAYLSGRRLGTALAERLG